MRTPPLFPSATADPLLSRAHDLLLRSKLTVAVAESCTGGLLGAALTELPGASAYFLGGVLAYSYELKTSLLGVDAQLIAEYGAVSAETATAMARGVVGLAGADVGIAVTGIAGPLGGTPSKPVGTTYVALALPGSEQVSAFWWGGSRDENRRSSVEAALQMLVTALEKRQSALSRAPLSRFQPE